MYMRARIPYKFLFLRDIFIIIERVSKNYTYIVINIFPLQYE